MISSDGFLWLAMWLLSGVRWQIFVDLLAMAAALNALFLWARAARVLRIALGVVGLHAVRYLHFA